jgi:proline iminopeptidase
MAKTKTYKRKQRTSKNKRNNKRNKTMKNKDPYKNTALYPPIKPLKEYKMKVSNIHTIAYSTYGNPDGKPVLYIHGGPGGGTHPSMARFFNPDKYYIVLVDQRGCGKSTPSEELRQNNTKNLIADFEKIRKHLKIDKWMVYGGSWGSTLSLAYAFVHPKRTSELVLRGIYFCTDDEVHWLSEGKGAGFIRPDGWDYFMKQIKGKKSKGLFIKEYQKCFQGKYGKAQKDKCLLAWSVWESSMSKLNMKPLSDIIKETKADNYRQVSAIELHYFVNNCFFKPNYFLKKSNLNKIKNIPVVIVQGMYDLVCPFFTAQKLHDALPHSKMYATMAGHTGFDKENIKYLVKTTDEFADRI